jgi:hypothetical protein
MPTENQSTNPSVGMMAIVRGKRRAVISEVRPFLGEDQVLHVVRVEYKDDQFPLSEELIWEREPYRKLLEPTALPNPSDPPMPTDQFDALLNASRWNALTPFLDPDADGPLDRMPICAPFHGAVQIEDYQLVPLLKALKMPRINLMIADDVGLGKTIEAGLILRELFIRRRIQRVLILTPASLRSQWREELWSKFSLRFDVIDRASTQLLKRSMGIDANPWRSSQRAIASYYYLRQPDVLEQFRSASQSADGSPVLPWDLLLVDEVHNLMPAPLGDDSELCKTLRAIAPYFEHRLFLSATPHNGHTRSFTGLLEMLDPVRFTRTSELKDAERQRIRQVVVRRLKREINERSNPPKFCNRLQPQAIALSFSKSEKRLIAALHSLRTKLRTLIKSEQGRRKVAGTFALEILSKRLLSGPATFANSWQRIKLGLQESLTASDSELAAAQKHLDEDTGDDAESERRNSTASTVIGSWLREFAPEITQEIADIDAAIAGMGMDISSPIDSPLIPRTDARFDTLTDRLKSLIVTPPNHWESNERLVIFTEYKTTLDYLLVRLRLHFSDSDNRIVALYGGMDDPARQYVKDLFNDPSSPARILLATDAASEGLNLQTTARYLLHYDCPWNPSRIEQRNGRLDRHGQARDVQTYHFASDEDADLKFMSVLINKVDQVREDLGAVGELLDEAFHRRLIDGDDAFELERELNREIDSAKKNVELPSDQTDAPLDAAQGVAGLESLAAEVGLNAESQFLTLDVAMGLNAGRPQLTTATQPHCAKIVNPSLSGWSDCIDESVRRSASDFHSASFVNSSSNASLGPVPLVTFSSQPFLHDISGRKIFRPNPNIQMVHLGHPLMTQAINLLGQRRYPGTKYSVSRWTARYANLQQDFHAPATCDAIIALHVEELGVNELRETFHHWVRTFYIPVLNGDLLAPLRHIPAGRVPTRRPISTSDGLSLAAEILAQVETDLQKQVKRLKSDLTKQLEKQLALDGNEAIKDEEKRFQSRQGEVSAMIEANTIQKLEREIKQLNQNKRQGILFENDAYLEELNRNIKRRQEEVDFRKKHYEEIRDQLTRERDRIINRLLPKRYALFGTAQVFPLAVEILLPSQETKPS